MPSDLTPEEKELHIQELTCINTSLSTLGHCISALIDKTRTHIPFRNSKLTRVLSDSLSGNGKITFIVCISPSMSAHGETFSTLQVKLKSKTFLNPNSLLIELRGLCQMVVIFNRKRPQYPRFFPLLTSRRRKNIRSCSDYIVKRNL